MRPRYEVWSHSPSSHLARVLNSQWLAPAKTLRVVINQIFISNLTGKTHSFKYTAIPSPHMWASFGYYSSQEWKRVWYILSVDGICHVMSSDVMWCHVCDPVLWHGQITQRSLVVSHQRGRQIILPNIAHNVSFTTAIINWLTTAGTTSQIIFRDQHQSVIGSPTKV